MAVMSVRRCFALCLAIDAIIATAFLLGCKEASQLDGEMSSVARMEVMLTSGTWVWTVGSGPFSESFAFTFRPDNTVGSRIYSDFTNAPVVRRWGLRASDRQRTYVLEYEEISPADRDDHSAFFYLPSGSLIRYDRNSRRIDILDTNISLRQVDGSVFDDRWFPVPPADGMEDM